MVDETGVVTTVKTNGFGYYRFDEVEAGKTYTFQPVGKTQRFDSRIITVLDETELNFNQ
jgi:hypothetical protein